MTRAFFAFDLDATTIRRVVDRVAAIPLCARSVPESKMHVTVRFLGSIDSALVPRLVAAVATSVASMRAPSLTVLRATGFPEAARARVVVLEADDSRGDLARLFAAVDTRVSELGLPREARAYRPHLTLARADRPIDARTFCEAFGEIDVASAIVREVVLYESAGGAYLPLARLPFAVA